MKIDKILIAGVIGGLAALIIGFLIFGIGLASFFEANGGGATNVRKGEDEFMWVPLVLGHITLGLLFAYVFGKWANISTFSTGAQVGAIMGFLIAATYHLINFATTNLMNLTGTIVNILVETIFMALAAGIVAMILGRGK